MHDQEPPKPRESWRRRLLSIAGGLVVLAFVLLTAPSWPDGPVKSVAIRVREGISVVWDGADQKTAEQTTRVFRVALGASEGYYVYTAGIPEAGDGFFGLSAGTPVSRLVEYLRKNIEQLTEVRARASSELAELAVLLGDLETQGLEDLLGVPLVRIREYAELVSDYDESFGESELAFTLCLSEQLERFPQDDLIGEVVLAAADPILQCAAEHGGDPDAEDELFSQMRVSTLFLVEGWGPRCLPSDVESSVESITEVVAEIACR